MIVRAGFASVGWHHAAVANEEIRDLQARWSAWTTLVSTSKPIRQPPTRWA